MKMFSKASSSNLLIKSPAGSWTDFLFLLLHKSPESNTKKISHSKHQSIHILITENLGLLRAVLCVFVVVQSIKPTYAEVDQKTIEQQDTCDA
jgi:hypothetical protein